MALARGLPRPALGLQCWLVLLGRDCLRLSALSLHAFGDITAKKVLPGGAASARPWLCCSGWDTRRGAGGDLRTGDGFPTRMGPGHAGRLAAPGLRVGPSSNPRPSVVTTTDSSRRCHGSPGGKRAPLLGHRPKALGMAPSSQPSRSEVFTVSAMTMLSEAKSFLCIWEGKLEPCRT